MKNKLLAGVGTILFLYTLYFFSTNVYGKHPEWNPFAAFAFGLFVSLITWWAILVLLGTIIAAYRDAKELLKELKTKKP